MEHANLREDYAHKFQGRDPPSAVARQAAARPARIRRTELPGRSRPHRPRHIDSQPYGDRSPATSYVRRAGALTLYGVTDSNILTSLEQLTRDIWKKGWWDSYVGDVHTRTIDLAWLEARAEKLRDFSPLVLPHLPSPVGTTYIEMPKAERLHVRLERHALDTEETRMEQLA